MTDIGSFKLQVGWITHAIRNRAGSFRYEDIDCIAYEPISFSMTFFYIKSDRSFDYKSFSGSPTELADLLKTLPSSFRLFI